MYYRNWLTPLWRQDVLPSTILKLRNSNVQGQEKMGDPSSKKETLFSISLNFFVLFGLSTDGIMLAHIGEDRTPLLSLLIKILISTGNRQI